jgi:DNA-binding MarR family transcriptional regulator
LKGLPGSPAEFAELFRAVYLTFHRRDGSRSQLPNASLAVLEHLAHAGPLTVGEAAAHLNRAQSVVSEIVSHLERQGMLERESDPADRRRTLVWLTGAGQDTVRRRTLPLPALHHSAARGFVRARLGHLAGWPARARSASQLAELGHPNHLNKVDQAARTGPRTTPSPIPGPGVPVLPSQQQCQQQGEREESARTQTARRGADGDASDEGRRAGGYRTRRKILSLKVD